MSATAPPPPQLGINEIAEAIFANFLAPHRAATAAQHAQIMARRKARRDKEAAARRTRNRPLTKKRVLVGVKKVKKGEVLEQRF